MRLAALLSVLILLPSTALAELPPDEIEIAKAAISAALTSEDATPATPLHVMEHSSFPQQALAVEQLKIAAARGYCGMDAASSIELLDRLIAKNPGRVPWGLTFGDARIAWVQTPQEDVDYVAISVPAIDGEGQRALIGMDMSGASGVLMLVKKIGDRWSLVDECAEWTSWR